VAGLSSSKMLARCWFGLPRRPKPGIRTLENFDKKNL